MFDQKILSLLEQARMSAQTGKNYATDIHNQNRYTDIISKIEQLYECIPNFNKLLLPPLDNTGYVTPKIGVNAILENQNGEILLEKRKDDQSWCIIGGWCEPDLSPEENIIKEIKEETGFDAEIISLIKIFARTPCATYPFSSYHILYHCSIKGGDLKVSHESEAVAFHDFNEVNNWHYDHKNWVEYYYSNH